MANINNKQTTYEKYGKRLDCRIPLIGAYLRHAACRKLAIDVNTGAVPLLVKAFNSKDKKLQSIAYKALRSLKQLESINKLCELWSENYDRKLGSIIEECGYVASKPDNIRVFSWLKAGRPSVISMPKVGSVKSYVDALFVDDPVISERSLMTLKELNDQELIDSLCGIWLSAKSGQTLEKIGNIIASCGYVASGPIKSRVMSWLKAGKPASVTFTDKEAVNYLVYALSNHDPVIADGALSTLKSLTIQKQIDRLCEMWLARYSGGLDRIITECRYIASEPIGTRVLSGLKCGQFEMFLNADPEHTKTLFKACLNDDKDISGNAYQVLVKLKRPESQQILCRLLLEKENPLAQKAAVSAGYSPSDRMEACLFLFLTGQWNAYENLDPDQMLLKDAYESTMPLLKQRLIKIAIEAGRNELVKIIIGQGESKRLCKITHGEWEMTLSVLKQHNDWEELWRLTSIVPPYWASKYLGELQETGWAPLNPGDINGFNKLSEISVGLLPDLLSGCCQIGPTILKGHEDIPLSLAISPDGRILASGGGAKDKSIRLWSLVEKKMLTVLKGHKGAVESLTISPDGHLLVSGSTDGTIRLWSFPEGRALATLNGGTNFKISPDGRLLVQGFNCWSLPDGEVLGTFKDHLNKHYYTYSTLSSDCRILATCNTKTDYELAIRLWSLPSGKELTTLTGHRRFLTCLTISPDSRILASGGFQDVRLWSLPNGDELAKVKEVFSEITDLAFSPDGQILACGGKAPKYSRNHILLRSVPQGEVLRNKGGGYGERENLAISPNGRLLGSWGSEDNTILLRILPDSFQEVPLKQQKAWVKCLTISPDNRFLVAGYTDKKIRIWDLMLFEYSNIPINFLTPYDIQKMEEFLKKAPTPGAKRWTEFILALTRWHDARDI